MSNNIASMLNSRLRMSGLASGLDTDTMIKQLMKVETMKVDKVKQQKQILEWRRDAYRDITNSLRGFRDTYMDVLSATNMRSQKNYKVFSVTSSDSKYVTASGTPDASAADHKVQVTNLAKAEVKQSSAGVSKDILGNAITDAAGASGKSFNLTIDGTTKAINIGTVGSLAELEASIQLGIDNAFGSGKVQVDITADNKLTFTPVGIGVSKIALSNASTNDALGVIGFTSGANFSNRLSIYETLETVGSRLKNGNISFTTVDDKEVVQLTIDNKSFTFSKSMTLSSMMSQISSDSEANVNMRYDEVNDRFVITSKQMGEGSNINISETGSDFLSKAALSQSSIAGTGSVTYGNLNGKAISMNINGVVRTVTFGPVASAADVQTAINSAFAGTGQSVTVDDSTGKLILSSVEPGSMYIGDPVSGTSALTELKMSASYISGEDAEAIIDEQNITRSENSFTISGVTYTLWKETEPAAEINIGLSMDTDKIFENIKAFVDKYNEVIGAINTELGEKYDRNYAPLTDEQKESMSEEDIKKWEEKAKTGILRNDGALQKIVSDMRRALYDEIEGVPNGIAKIGITTGSYQENGKLIINETELRKAIQNTPDLVMNIFSKESSTTYFDTLDDKDKKKSRYEQNGLANRLYDIIQDNIRTIRDKDDKKGVLLEIAGIAGDITEFDSVIVDEIERKDKQIDDLLDKLYDKETAYYQKFAAMESALSQMNSQSSWLTQQFGGGQ